MVYGFGRGSGRREGAGFGFKGSTPPWPYTSTAVAHPCRGAGIQDWLWLHHTCLLNQRILLKCLEEKRAIG